MNPLRSAIGLSLVLALAACGKQAAPEQSAALPHLERFTVAANGAAPGQAWDGVVEAVQQAELAAQTSGRVTQVLVDVNDKVASGQVLLRLTAVEQQAGAEAARAQLRAAEASAAEAQANYARYAALGGKQYVSRLQLDQAKAARDAAVAARDAARAQLAQAGQQADYTVVRAPFAGIISARQVEPGESLAPGQPLLSLYAPGALRIQVQVPESDAAAIRAAPRARILLANGQAVDAAAVTVFPAADPATHSVAVRAQLPSMPQSPVPGVTAKVVFAIAGESAGVWVPKSAVVQRGELSAVYVLADGRLTMRQLRLGQSAADRVEILAGLKPGEVLAADPVAALQALESQRQASKGGARD